MTDAPSATALTALPAPPGVVVSVAAIDQDVAAHRQEPPCKANPG